MDLTRQVLSKLANSVYFQVIAAYQSGEGFQVEKLSDLFLELMCDMETLLATEQGFLLGPWLEAAKRLGTNEEEEELVSTFHCCKLTCVATGCCGHCE